MAVELARAHALAKLWGVTDLRPWCNTRHVGNAIGEIWYERTAGAPANSSSCSSCCLRASHCPSKSIPTMRLRFRWAWREENPRPGTS